MARRRASMREGPLAELFRATEAAQKQAESGSTEQPPEDAATSAPPAETEAPAEPDERTVEHVPSWEESGVETPAPPTPSPEPSPAPPVPDPQPPAGGSSFGRQKRNHDRAVRVEYAGRKCAKEARE